MNDKYLLALDQGTTSSRAVLFGLDGRLIGFRGREFPQMYPRPGWVEHNPEVICDTQVATAQQVLADFNVAAGDVAAIGITNQRETVLVWDRGTGKPLSNAIVWQCRRTAPFCDHLRGAGWADPIQEKTGLVLDAYFSATKIAWLLDNVPGLRARAEKGEVACGNIDTWLIWKLTEGRVHATDYSNASRTMLFNINKLEWDREILSELKITAAMLPPVMPSSHVFGETETRPFGNPIPIAGDAGDQQAALFGQACFQPGMVKNTYGTGCFLLMNTGETRARSEHRLLNTIAWGLGGKVTYALEGSIFVAGAVVQWLRDGLGLIREASESEDLATRVDDNGGVYLVPAFVGLGAPHWDMYARGTIVGVTRGTSREHIVRAALEAIPYQTRDVLAAMRADSGVPLAALRVDGGAACNNFLMQFQADCIQIPVERPAITETTALGAAYLAGLGVGVWSDIAEIAGRWSCERRFVPERNLDHEYRCWQRAVARAARWAEI
jgi:glycerol kinase